MSGAIKNLGIVSVTSVADSKIWWHCKQIDQQLDVLERLPQYENSNQNVVKCVEEIKRHRKELSSLGITYDERSKTPAYDQTSIEDDFELIRKLRLPTSSVHGNDSAASVESQKNLLRLLGRDWGDIMEVAPTWRNYPVHVAIFAGHGLERDNKFCLYSEYFQRGNHYANYYPISRYWHEWWAFVEKNNMEDRHAILVLDMCHSGSVFRELQTWLNDTGDDMENRRCSITIQASCSSSELARGGYFLKAWLSVFQSGISDIANDIFEDLNDLPSASWDQSPCYFTTLTDVNNGFVTVNEINVQLFSNPVLLHAVWMSLHSDLTSHFRGGKSAQSACMHEIETEHLPNGSYEVLDVKCFYSGVKDGEYQLLAILSSPTGLVWSQHCHLQTAALAEGRWVVSTSLTARPVEVAVSVAQEGHTFMTFLLPNQSLTEFMSRPHKDVIVGETIRRRDGAVVTSQSEQKYEEQPRASAKSSFKFTDSSGAHFINKVRSFMNQHSKRRVFSKHSSSFIPLREYLALNSGASIELTPEKWHMVVSILGFSRTRGAFCFADGDDSVQHNDV